MPDTTIYRKELQSGSKLRIVEQEISHKQYQNQQRKAELREQAYEIELLKRNLFVLVIIFISLIVLSIFLYQWYKRKKNMQLMVTRYNLEQSEHLNVKASTASKSVKKTTNTAAKKATKKTIKVGDYVKPTGSRYATGQKIPNWVKQRKHRVSQIKSSQNKVLLGHPNGINSWVYLSEVTLA